jgi:hypothetical protein
MIDCRSCGLCAPDDSTRPFTLSLSHHAARARVECRGTDRRQLRPRPQHHRRRRRDLQHRRRIHNRTLRCQVTPSPLRAPVVHGSCARPDYCLAPSQCGRHRTPSTKALLPSTRSSKAHASRPRRPRPRCRGRMRDGGAPVHATGRPPADAREVGALQTRGSRRGSGSSRRTPCRSAAPPHRAAPDCESGLPKTARCTGPRHWRGAQSPRSDNA